MWYIERSAAEISIISKQIKNTKACIFGGTRFNGVWFKYFLYKKRTINEIIHLIISGISKSAVGIYSKLTICKEITTLLTNIHADSKIRKYMGIKNNQ